VACAIDCQTSSLLTPSGSFSGAFSPQPAGVFTGHSTAAAAGTGAAACSPRRNCHAKLSRAMRRTGGVEFTVTVSVPTAFLTAVARMNHADWAMGKPVTLANSVTGYSMTSLDSSHLAALTPPAPPPEQQAAAQLITAPLIQAMTACESWT